MSIRKYSVLIAGHHTSVSLEPEFWEELKKLAARQDLTPAELITRIDADRQGSLSSELRLYVLRALISGN
ncbi:MAG: ribbon-helix-helix domain-containing protein [Alphaproteobacteria bacterium]